MTDVIHYRLTMHTLIVEKKVSLLHTPTITKVIQATPNNHIKEIITKTNGSNANQTMVLPQQHKKITKTKVNPLYQGRCKVTAGKKIYWPRLYTGADK